MFVGGCGWLWVVAYFSIITHKLMKLKYLTSVELPAHGWKIIK